MKKSFDQTRPVIFWPIVVSIALSAVTLCPQGLSQESSGPYPVIARRNIFDLQPIIVQRPAEVAPTVPPADFRLIGAKEHQGIRSAILAIQYSSGPGQAPASKTYTIREGETAGPITILRIANVKSGEMDIVNNGMKMSIGFRSHAGKLPSTPIAMAGMAPQVHAGASPAGATASSINAAQQSQDFARANNQAQALSPTAAVSMVSPGDPSLQPPVSVEVQAIMIEMERVRTQPLVDRGLQPPLPPTGAE
jgi:hypothetical protein